MKSFKVDEAVEILMAEMEEGKIYLIGIPSATDDELSSMAEHLERRCNEANVRFKGFLVNREIDVKEVKSTIEVYDENHHCGNCGTASRFIESVSELRKWFFVDERWFCSKFCYSEWQEKHKVE